MEQEHLFSAILENVHDGIIAIDGNLDIKYANPAALKMSGWEQIPMDTNAAQVFTLLEPKNLANLITKKLPRDEEPHIFKDTIYKCGRNTLIVDGSISRIPEEDGRPMGYVIVFRDISDMKKLNASLEYQVSHDSLTGLVNREGFNLQLEDILDSVKRINSDCSLLKIDIDSYDTVRTEMGEAGGNALLTWFTGILQSHTKHQDLSARLGGGVFTMVLFGCTMEEAKGVAERIHESAGGFVFEDKSFAVSVSIGIVPISDKTVFAAGLLSSVDKACSQAKKAGGGQTVIG